MYYYATDLRVNIYALGLKKKKNHIFNYVVKSLLSFWKRSINSLLLLLLLNTKSPRVALIKLLS